MNSVILIGMPGSGKSTVTDVYYRKYNELVFDTDEVITVRFGEITKIFAEHGEKYFRDIETEVLREVCAERDCFISVGGGCVLKEENVRIMKSGGNKIVYLRTSLETLEKRLKNDTSRPLLQGGLRERLQKLFFERSAIYESVADVTVDTDGLTPEEIFENICSIIGISGKDKK